jgi:hypothetical protein
MSANGADLTRADLTGTELFGADFTDAELSGAKWPVEMPAPEGWVADPGSGQLARAVQISG